MAFNASNPLGTGTDQELLDFARAAIARILTMGFMRTAQGRTLTEANLKELRDQVVWLEQRIAAAANTGGSSVNYAKRGKPL